jgi:hypothetical protein
MTKILLAALAALALLLGLHTVFGLALLAVLAAGLMVGMRGMETGWGIVPRAARS